MLIVSIPALLGIIFAVGVGILILRAVVNFTLRGAPWRKAGKQNQNGTFLVCLARFLGLVIAFAATLAILVRFVLLSEFFTK